MTEPTPQAPLAQPDSPLSHAAEGKKAFKMTPHVRTVPGHQGAISPDCLLFYRMGDFYELFFDDAVLVARELQLTLTSRSKDTDGVPMCGVPWHAVKPNISQLVERGYKVAVCDQIEDPRSAKGLVKRAVTQVVTAGTTLEDMNLEAKAHNYLGALFWNETAGAGGFAWVDASTGSWSGLQSSKAAELWQWVLKMAPRELLVAEQSDTPDSLKLQDAIHLVRVPYRSHFEPKQATERVMTAQGVKDLATLGLEKRRELLQACGALVAYLTQTQQQDPRHLTPFRPMDLGRHLILDEITERNLELFRRLDGRKGPGTLWHVLDETRTPMGGRLLEERMRYPWRDAAPITATQDAVALLHEDAALRANVRESLNQVYDLERLSTRISLNRCQPRDLAALKESVLALPAVRTTLLCDPGPLAGVDEARRDRLPIAVARLLGQWDDLADVAGLLDRALRDELPLQVTEGGLFKAGYDAELDELLDLVEHGEARLQDLLAREQRENNLPKLKLGYNRVFGYFFELTKSQLSGNIPDHFQRRQTMANAERYTTPELKELEDKLMNAAESRKSLEYRLFQDLRTRLADVRPRLLFMADMLAQIDLWQSLAETAARWGWVRPELHEDGETRILQGRHPVVEAVSGRAGFIPNDLVLDERRRILLITGPNMAGKSTTLRQTALLCLLAQMGSFVPATKARIGLVDRIFSRVGASDNLAQGQSAFMVEMMETARILRQATKRSLVILDEIGRGTSTYDGMALAWAVVEDLARRAGGRIRTPFATHYHELTGLEGRIPGLFNMNIAIREWKGEIVFTRKLVPGPADKSYGIEVARLAGVPAPVVQRAREILAPLEESRGNAGLLKPSSMTLPGLALTAPRSAMAPRLVPDPQTVLNTPSEEARIHPLVKELARLDPDELTPLDALRTLVEWKQLWSKDDD